MNNFHEIEWDKKSIALDKFQDERLKYFGQKLLYSEKPELLPKELYNEIHKDVASKLLVKIQKNGIPFLKLMQKSIH